MPPAASITSFVARTVVADFGGALEFEGPGLTTGTKDIPAAVVPFKMILFTLEPVIT